MKGGTCIDHVLSNCLFASESGVCGEIIADTLLFMPSINKLWKKILWLQKRLGTRVSLIIEFSRI